MKSSPYLNSDDYGLSGQGPLIALVGNPNAGKTTLFNALTGSHQKVGNYPGVTVEKIAGQLTLNGQIVDCIDVPGLYSMIPVSEDEKVAADVVEGRSDGTRKPDLLVCVIDATNLERNLYIFTQLAEAGHSIVVALTMADRLAPRGDEIDIPRLSDLLGVDIVPVVGHKDDGVEDLRDAIERNLETPKHPTVELGLPGPLENKVAALQEKLAVKGAAFTKSEIRRELLNPSTVFGSFLDDYPEIKQSFAEARDKLKDQGFFKPTLDVATRYQWAGMIQRAVIRHSESHKTQLSLTDKLDRVFTNRVFGLLVFVGLMYLVFQSIYTVAQPIMNGIDGVFKWAGGIVSPPLAGHPILWSLVVDGLIKGAGSVFVFLPQIMILFFFISVLEGTGYLARAAFLMDRLLGWCGLNGRAFIPLLSSFACAIPGIMAARTMPDPKSRLATILVSPLMSCSARLPVYVLIIGTFIQPKYGAFWAGFALFGMHFLGLVIAIPIVAVLNRKVIKGKRLPFMLELPPYQWPKWRDVWVAMVIRARVFVRTAGTIIVMMSMVIWALCTFPVMSTAQEIQTKENYAAQTPGVTGDQIERHLQEQRLAQSILGRFGKTIEPVFKPAGFDWRITTSILAAFPARETVVPSLGIIFSLGGDVDEKDTSLHKSLSEATWPDGRPLFTPWVAVGLMVFFALCAQCMATLATVKRETNSWKWPLFMFTYMTTLAYIAAVAIHQVGRLFGG